MRLKTKLSSWSRNILKYKKLAIAGGFVASALLMIAILLWLPLPWQLAHKDTIPTKPVTLTVKDHVDDWLAEFEGEVYGAGGHWLGHKGPNVPMKKTGGLWYDGTFIVKETGNTFLRSYLISSNGEHYAYDIEMMRTDTDTTTESKIIVDGKTIAQGKGIVLYEITDTGDVYYTCLICGSDGNGFFMNNEKLIDKQDDDYWGGPENRQQIQCLFKRDTNTKQLTDALTATSNGIEMTACSPNGKHIVKNKMESVWPEGSKDVLFMNGSKIDEGRIENWVVNNEGKVTYLKRNSPLPGLTSLTINGRPNYIISNVDDSSRVLYSPSLKNIAVVQGGKWWVNGRATDVDQYENVSLGDTAFYVYRF